MMVQLLGLHASTTGGLGSMPSQGTNPANSGKDKKKTDPRSHICSFSQPPHHCLSLSTFIHSL